MQEDHNSVREKKEERMGRGEGSGEEKKTCSKGVRPSFHSSKVNSI